MIDYTYFGCPRHPVYITCHSANKATRLPKPMKRVDYIYCRLINLQSRQVGRYRSKHEGVAGSNNRLGDKIARARYFTTLLS